MSWRIDVAVCLKAVTAMREVGTTDPDYHLWREFAGLLERHARSVEYLNDPGNWGGKRLPWPEEIVDPSYVRIAREFVVGRRIEDPDHHPPLRLGPSYTVAEAWHDVTCPEAEECGDRAMHTMSSPLVNSGVLDRLLDRLGYRLPAN